MEILLAKYLIIEDKNRGAKTVFVFLSCTKFAHPLHLFMPYKSYGENCLWMTEMIGSKLEGFLHLHKSGT